VQEIEPPATGDGDAILEDMNFPGDAMDGEPKPPTDDPLADRLRLVRVKLYGESGTRALAGALGLPPRTWTNYERGVKTSGEVLLRFIELTGVRPHWLLTGDGERYRADQY
jgi:hypothetical protein